MNSILFIDLETQNHEYYGSKASPYCPDNYIVESGWRVDITDDSGKVHTGDTQSIRYESKEDFFGAPVTQWLQIPKDCWLIVAHNAAYEISWFLTHGRDVFEDFLKRGGRIWCTMQGEYLATNQLSQYASLDETAPKYGGTHKVDGVKILWEQGVLTSDIDPAILHEYLTSKSGDVDNTALCFYGQYSVLQEQDKIKLTWLRMKGMVAFAYCEWFGMFINMPTAVKQQAEQEADIAKLTAQLTEYLPKDIPSEFVFNWGSDYHVSALLFGGPIKYTGKVEYEPRAYEKADFYCIEYTDTKENKFVLVSETELTADNCVQVGNIGIGVQTYKSGKNKGQPKIHRLDTDIIKYKNADLYYTFAGLIPIASMPQVLREQFGDRGAFYGARKLSDGTPVYSSSGDNLATLAKHGYEIAKTLSSLATLEKDTGTYYMRTEYKADGTPKKVKGMLQFVIPTQEDGSGIIHHRLNTCATITGRLSSSNPNLQNLPRDGTSNVKKLFTSRFGDGGKIIEVDYSALEVVMSCVFTGDKKLLQLLQDGIDMHCYRLSFKLKEPYEEVFNKCHDKTNPEHKKYKEMRTRIKTPSFAAQYGAGAAGIAYSTGLPLEECQEFLDNELALFPDTINFRSVIREEVERSSLDPKNIFREQNEDGSFSVYRRGYWTAPSGMRYSFRQYPKTTYDPVTRKRTQVMDFKDTELANYWCQGEAFFMMDVAFGLILDELLKNNFYDNQVALITNVHDAVYLDAKNEEVATAAALMAKKCMEEARLEILKHFPKYGHLDEIMFPAAAEMGDSMYSKVEVKQAA